MGRNTKVLGLALCAVLVVAAVCAQGAWANVSHTFQCGDASCFVTSEAHPQAKEQKLSIGEAVVQCQELHLTGTTAEETTDEFELIPQFTNCSFAGLETTVTNVGTTKPGETSGGCKFRLDSDTSVNSSTAGTEDGTLLVECQTGKSITIELFISTNHEEGKSICTVHIEPQGGLHGVSYTNVQTTAKPREVTAHAKVHGVRFTSNGEFCALAGIPVEGNAIYSGTWTIRDYEDNNGVKGAQVNSELTTP